MGDTLDMKGLPTVVSVSRYEHKHLGLGISQDSSQFFKFMWERGRYEERDGLAGSVG